MTEVTIFPGSTIADASLAAFELDSARFGHVAVLRSLDAVLEELVAAFAMYTLGDSILVPRWAIDETQASLSERFLADLGSACIILALEEVPPLLLCGAWAKIIVSASTGRFECILDAKLLDITSALFFAMHASYTVIVMFVVVRN